MDDDIMDDLPSIPSCSFYGKQKVRSPPPPAVPENSESSDDEKEITLKTIQEKIRPSKFLFEADGNNNNSEGKFFSSEEEAISNVLISPRRKRRKLNKQYSVESR
ncbi:hypothetical protein HHI36_016675 [Cryptolaemus montrouzieri]|uniref:Uncharacterized protein n=1 Tax=Cryptolaemus montrouzieri TaxID=559131 RepID=A0ABD2NLI2_9CUCU